MKHQASKALLCLCFCTCALCFVRVKLISCNRSLPNRQATLQHWPLQSSGTEIKTFEQFHGVFPDWLIEKCKDLGFTEPTEVQFAAIPVILEGKDTIVQAQTGSGKTLVFSLPILARIDPTRAAIQAVIIVPTRELGLQVVTVLRQLSQGSPVKITVMPIFEGSQNRRQQLWATAEPPHIVVGNPKALQKLVDNGRLRLNAVNFIVIDEVDACLLRPETRQELHRLLSRHLSSTFREPEFLDEVSLNLKNNRVVRSLGSNSRTVNAFRGERQSIMCSATIPQRRHFAAACFSNGWTDTLPTLIHTSKDNLLPENIEHEIVPCRIDQRLPLTAFLLRDAAKAREDQQLPPTIVFVDEEEAIVRYADYIAKSLTKNQLLQRHKDLCVLTGEMNIGERCWSMDAFRRGEAKVLVCTDLAARGIDIPATSLVIQMSLPHTADDYLHRSGRTGRLGRPGKVITLIQEEESFVVKRFMNELDIVMHKRILQAKS